MPDETAINGCRGKHCASVSVCGRQDGTGSGTGLQVAVLVPAYNEAGSIEATLDGLMGQGRQPNRIVVISKGCTDDTACRARKYPVTVLELPRLAHRKSEALNRGWKKYAKDADIVVCLDADTVLPPNAIESWAREFAADADGMLGGSSSKFTMQQTGLLSQLQKAEFATWTDDCLRRGSTSVLAGTGCAINDRALRERHAPAALDLRPRRVSCLGRLPRHRHSVVAAHALRSARHQASTLDPALGLEDLLPSPNTKTYLRTASRWGQSCAPQ